MKLPPFLLDQWLDQKNSANPPIEFDLGSSTGPVWTLGELLALEGEVFDRRLLDTKLVYTPPAGSLELREAIANLSGADPDTVQVTTGAAEALLILFFSIAEPGANIVLPNPGFPTNTAVAESLGIEIRHYALRRENGFRIDIDEMKTVADRNTRLIFVNSPHNPTGATLSDAEMDVLHEFCAERGIQFVSDEVYHPIYHGPETRSAARLPHATVLSDFSKALSMSGLRVGWMIERDAHRREQYLNARSYFTVSNTILGERLAAIALRHSESIYRRARDIAGSNLRLLDRFMDEHSGTLDWVRPRGGMTAFPWLRDSGDARPFCRQLMKRGVLLAPGDCFGMPSHFRMGFGASGHGFPQALERCGHFLAKNNEMAIENPMTTTMRRTA